MAVAALEKKTTELIGPSQEVSSERGHKCGRREQMLNWQMGAGSRAGDK